MTKIPYKIGPGRFNPGRVVQKGGHPGPLPLRLSESDLGRVVLEAADGGVAPMAQQSPELSGPMAMVKAPPGVGTIG